jgi:hypothetical protein
MCQTVVCITSCKGIESSNLVKILSFFCEGQPWRSGKAVALWPWGHGFKSWKQPLAEMQGKTAYIRPKVVRPFSGPWASGSYVHWAALYYLSPVLKAGLTTGYRLWGIKIGCLPNKNLL